MGYETPMYLCPGSVPYLVDVITGDHGSQICCHSAEMFCNVLPSSTGMIGISMRIRQSVVLIMLSNRMTKHISLNPKKGGLQKSLKRVEGGAILPTDYIWYSGPLNGA